MKKYFILTLILISVILIISCVPTTSEEIPIQKETTPIPGPVQEATSEPPQIIEKAPHPIEKKIPPVLEKVIEKAQETKQLPLLATEVQTTPIPEIKPILSLIETFDGTIIDHSKYDTKIVGTGTIKQDNQLIMSGNSEYGIIWDAIYTQKKYNLMNNFNISAKVNLSGKASIGNIVGVIGIEDLSLITEGKNPERGYCEISMGSDGKILRMSKSVGHLDNDIPLSGILTLSYNTKLEKLTCSFNKYIITQYQDTISGEYLGTLRSGLNYATGGGLESEGIGSFTTTFDNWYIQQE